MARGVHVQFETSGRVLGEYYCSSGRLLRNDDRIATVEEVMGSGIRDSGQRAGQDAEGVRLEVKYLQVVPAVVQFRLFVGGGIGDAAAAMEDSDRARGFEGHRFLLHLLLLLLGSDGLRIPEEEETEAAEDR